MRRVLLWAGVAAGLAVLGLLGASAYASLSALGTLAAPAPPPPAPPADPFPARAEATTASPPPAPAPPAPVAPPPAEAPRPALRPPPEPPAPPATPFLQRATAVNRASADLERGLTARRAEFAPCFGEGQAGFAGQPVTSAANADAEDPGSPVFALQVTYKNGLLYVDEAPVEVRSGASEATLACLQAKLRRMEVKTDAVPKAQHFRVHYNLVP